MVALLVSIQSAFVIILQMIRKLTTEKSLLSIEGWTIVKNSA